MVFVCCELCQRMSDKYDEIDDTFGQFCWYRFPDEMKRMLPMVILFIQQPIVIECFGSIACNRETFKNVSSTDEKKNQM